MRSLVHGHSQEDNVSDVIPQAEYFAYDIRTDMVYKFRRMNKYVLLQTIPWGTFMKLSLEDFDQFFEGTPEPLSPLIVRVQ